MSVQDNRFPELLARFRARDPEVCRVWFDAFQRALLPALRRRISPRLQAACDAEDALQGACCVLVANLGQIPFSSFRQVIAYLYGVATRRLHNAHRRCLDGKHLSDRNRRSLDVLAGSALVAPGPGPEDEAMTREGWGCLVRQHPQARDVLDLASQGYTQREIAVNLGMSDRHLRRLLASLRPWARALFGITPADRSPHP
jgi:DNA-directed RNA polymerase specialized sigma24 family protein